MQGTGAQSLDQEDLSGEGNGNPLQYSCLENSMDGGAWLATVHGIAKSPMQLTLSLFFPTIYTSLMLVSSLSPGKALMAHLSSVFALLWEEVRCLQRGLQGPL